jgi:hypothetical protein
MGQKFNFAKLFATSWKRDPKLALYPTIKAHLDAMSSGRKRGLSLFGFMMSDVANRGQDFRELLKLACERGLVVVHYNEPIKGLEFERRDDTVLVARPDELWRVPAWIALWKTAFADGRWSNAAEAQSSMLLGYTEKERARWLAAMREHQPAWTCATVYALLTVEQKRRVLSLGQRCFGDDTQLASIKLLFKRNDYGMRPNAVRLVPGDLTLARVGLRWPTFRKLFPEARNGRKEIVETRVPLKLAPAVNRDLVSKVQLLTTKGWK